MTDDDPDTMDAAEGRHVDVTDSGVVEPVDESVTDTPDEAPGTVRPRRRFDRGLFFASFAIAVGVLFVIFGVTTAMTGDDGIDRPVAIESVQPVENAVQVLRQERIVVDLQSGYEARLVVDGVELPTTKIGQADVDPQQVPKPGEQIDLPTTAVFDPGNAVISFQPVEGALVETFTEGIHEVEVIFWKIEDGPEQALSYRWKFDVV